MSQLSLFAGDADVHDADVRVALRTQLHRSCFVEAGAGTGKTAVLVDRVVALVTADPAAGGGIPMRTIAAITFTEKAAAELRDRIRRALEHCSTSDDDPSARERASRALDELDGAAICTLHAFAQRLLTAVPIEAGLPPSIHVRDEIASRVAFEERWREFVDRLLEDPALEPAMLLMLAAGVRLEHLRAVAEVLNDNWDLLDRVDSAPPLASLAIEPWLAELDSLGARSAECRAPDDALAARLGEISEYGRDIAAALDDIERVRLLKREKPSFRVTRCGRKNSWPDIDDVRERVIRLGEARDRLVDTVLDPAIRHVVGALARCTADAVRDRTVDGELEFHDLLVLARRVLRDPRHEARARAQLHDRYQRILVDEFQDTDPIQIDLAVLLATARADVDGVAWTDLPVEDGRLFFVGDPKQSIYRFRRADVGTYLTALERFGESMPDVLSCNFRSAPAVLDWINRVFAELIRPYPRMQPEYRPLQPARAALGDAPVRLLGAVPHDDIADADDLRTREAADVAAAISTIMREGWMVSDRDADVRAARLGDICVLLPARTSLAFLEAALDHAGIPFRVESSSLVYSSREIRDVLMTLRAVDDASDALALASALRSPLFGCGDDDLFEFHVEHGGRWSLFAEPPDSLPDSNPVGEAIRYLRTLHASAPWCAPSELFDRIVRDRCVLEVAALGARYRDISRRIRFVIDQARAFTDATRGGLRDYLAWAAMQGAEGARVVEVVLPETDDDAVRIMTIHAAKGLEFPIVVCSGATTAAQAPRRGVQVLFPSSGGCEIKLSSGVQTTHFELHKPVDEQMEFHEKIRLLYVACTRARDHLVVSVHRKARDLDRFERPRWTHAELLWEAAQRATGEAWSPRGGMPRRQAQRSDVDVLTPAQWEAARIEAFVSGARRASVSPTALARARVEDPGLMKDARDLDLPPWKKGRYGTQIGRAVHGVLQSVDLAGTGELDAAVAAQAAAEGLFGHESTIGALVRAALAHPTIARAGSRPHWRETYVAVPLDGILLEGYVDLVFRDDDGLVIVDYKTDHVSGEALGERLDHYRMQVGAYALAVGQATGEPVARAELCFLAVDGASSVVLDGTELEDAMRAVVVAAARERDDPSPLPAAVLVET